MMKDMRRQFLQLLEGIGFVDRDLVSGIKEPHGMYADKVGSLLQCVAVCCSVLQCVAVCCSVLQCVAVCCSLLQCVAVCCSVK